MSNLDYVTEHELELEVEVVAAGGSGGIRKTSRRCCCSSIPNPRGSILMFEVGAARGGE